jgi:hypothetical protein
MERQIITLVPDIDEFGTRPEPGKITLDFDEQLGLTVRVILTPEVADCLKTHLSMALEITDKHITHYWDDKKGWVMKQQDESGAE